jgi:cytochrome c oxidase subunit III
MATNKTRDTEKSVSISRVEKFHPYKTLLFFGLLGSTIVFLTLTFLYLTTLSENVDAAKFQFPKAFTLSAFLLLFSSYTISKSLKAFKDDSFDQLLKSIIATIVLSFAFCLTQFMGYKALNDAGYFSEFPTSSIYFLVITGIHLLYIVAGIIMLSYIAYKAYDQSQDMVDSLLYFSDKNQQVKIEMTSVFWHFVDFVWLSLFLMFLFVF